MSLMTFKKLAYACSPSAIHPLFKRIEVSDVGSRLASGVFWSMAGSVISRGLMLCATVLVARMLGKTVYGELGIIQSTVGMLGVFAGFGLGLTTTKHVAEFRKKDPERAGRIIALSGLFAMGAGGIMALVLLILAPWLAAQTINAPHLAGVLRLGSLILFINALNGAQTGALAGFEAFKTIAHVNLFVGLLSFPILVCGAHFGGLIGVVWALALNLVFNWLLNHIALRKEARRHAVPFTVNDCSRELPILWNFALPAALSGVMVGPANWACRALLTNQPNGYDEMGILTATMVFQNILLFVSGMLSAPLLSMVSNAGTSISRNLANVNILVSWIVGAVLAIPLLCFPEVAQIMFGTDYATHSFRITFSLVVFSGIVMMFHAGVARALVANNLLWWGFFSNVLWALALIGSSMFLVRWGAAGLATSLVVAYVLSTVIFFPLHYSRNLVPKRMLLSLESVSIWLLFGSLVVLNVADVTLMFRSFVFIPSMLIAVISFKRLAEDDVAAKETKQSNE